MSDVPTIEEELERKVSETLADALHQLQRGETTPEAAKATLNALWGATAGLVSKEMMEIIAESIDAVDLEESAPRRRVFRKGQTVVILDLPELARMQVNVIMPGSSGKQVRSLGNDDDTLRDLVKKARKAVNSFIENGYREIAG